MSPRTRHILLIVGLGVVIFVPGIFTRDLWNPDEPRYAEVSREMRVTGEYLVPHLNGRIYAEKPPLFFWMSAGLQGVFGFAAGRVVNALLAIGVMLLTYALGRLWYPPSTALLAACILGTSALFIFIGHAGVLDVPLTFFTLLSIYAFYRGGRWLPLYYIGMGLAVLTKGPVGIALVLFATARPGRAWHPAWGIPLMLAVIAAWVWPACIRGGDEYTNTILFRQNVGRMVKSFSHQRPFWYHVPLLVWFFPWIVIAPRAFPWAWRERRRLFLWFVIGFVFFSCVSGKRERYLLPLYPALALMVAGYATTAMKERAYRLPAIVMAGFGIGLVAVALLGSFLSDRFADDSGVMRALQWSPGLIVGGAVVWALGRLGRRRLDPRYAVAAMVALFLVFDLVLTPRINDVKSSRPVAEALNELASGGATIAMYPKGFAGPYNLYTGRVHIPQLETAEALEAFLASPGRRVVLTSQRHHEKLDSPYNEIVVRPVGSRVMVFLTNFK